MERTPLATLLDAIDALPEAADALSSEEGGRLYNLAVDRTLEQHGWEENDYVHELATLICQQDRPTATELVQGGCTTA